MSVSTRKMTAPELRYAQRSWLTQLLIVVAIAMRTVHGQSLPQQQLDDPNNLLNNNNNNNINNPFPQQPGGFYNSVGGGGGTSALLNSNAIDLNSYCPEFWIAYRSTCYRFFKSPKRNWLNAKKLCQANQGDLINVDTLDKHAFILRELLAQNHKHNKYLVSARKTGPNSWINADNTAFIQIDDSLFNLTTHSMSQLSKNQIADFDLYNQDERNLLTDGQSNNNYNNVDTNDKLNQNYNTLSSTNNNYYQQQQQRDRLVYAFSSLKNRWLFAPVFDFEYHLFICESQQLFSINNINVQADNRRTYSYGIEIVDAKFIPRGPYFLKQPRDTTYDTAKTTHTKDVTLYCLAGGYPTPTYTWYRELFVQDTLKFALLDPLQDSRLTISGGNLIITMPTQETDQGTYHCIAENRYGRIISESVQLNFGFIMEFNLKRNTDIGNKNWGHVLACDPPQNFPAVKYYWSRSYFPNFVEEDQRVFVSHDGGLYFSVLDSIDRGNYSCTVQSVVSNTGRNGPFFNLRVQPHRNNQDLIFVHSFPKVFPDAPIAGEEIRLECVAFGYPVPTYNWTRVEYGLPKSSYQISYNRVLIIPNATVNDNGEYVCTVHNDRNILSKSLYLNIQMKPNFTIPLQDRIKDLNSDVSFLCEANAIPDVNYTWYKNAERMDVDKLDRYKYTIQDNVLTIKFLTPDKDDGMYQCRAENQLKAVYSSAQLRVVAMKPSFKKRPLESEIYAIYNGNTTILCDPEAAPRPKFQWKKDGSVIGVGQHRQILQNGALLIMPTSRDDEGIYTCVASNQYGTDESRARLIVLQELRFTQTLPATKILNINELLYLRCEVSYDEILDVAFVWLHNEQIIQPNDDPRFIIDYNSLEVQNVTLLDTGSYACIAKSAVNQIISKTIVTVQGPPGAPGGLKVIDIRKTSAVLEWIDGTDNGRPMLYYNILGRTNWNRTWTNVSEMVRAHDIDRYNGRKQAEVTNLTPWSGYEFSVCAVNDLGIGLPSSPSPLYSTHTDRPYIAPLQVGGGGGKIGDLTITWRPLLPQHQNGHGIHYKIFWRLHSNNTLAEWATHVLEKENFGANDGRAVVHIPLDNYFMRYDVRVQAINDLGKSPESDVAIIYSAEDMPQVAPQQPIASSFNSTALNMSWVPVEETREKIRGKLIGHRLKYWKKDHHEEDAVYYLSRTTQAWALIVGLEPDTYYFVKVMAYNSAGEGPESERYLERTYRKAPQKPPSSVNFYGINPSTIRVIWRYVAPTLEEEPIQGYKVRVWESDQDMSTANDTIVVVGNKLESYIDNLKPGKAYKMRVLAFSNGGDGRMSSPTSLFQMGITNQVRN